MDETIDQLKNKINSKKILVVTGNYEQFKLFCNEKLMDYEENNNLEFEGVEFFYYSGESVKGCRFDDVIKFGTWYERKEIDWNKDIYPSMKMEYWAKYDKLWLVGGGLILS